ncbi:hypothetical protein BBP40_005713 [Aspergillus hancockii]|nr:hypothetical protein BBP40_005713 [Aspergillus hancockii]
MERLRQIAAHLYPHLSSLHGPILGASRASLSHVKNYAAQVDWSNALKNAMQYSKENPIKVIWKTLNVVVLLLPGVVAGPFLQAIGFTRLGPAANSIATWWHAFLGDAVGGGIFAYVQSAGMGGYGRVLVENGFRVLVLVPHAALRLIRR